MAGGDVMIDLETLGLKPGCAIAAIGAVFIQGGEIVSDFYRRINWGQSVTKYRLELDPATVRWWLGQSSEATQELTADGGHTLRQALIDFQRWLKKRSPENNHLVWGNGSDFDNVILDAAYQRLALNRPWGDFSNRCYRTLAKAFPEIPRPKPEVKHHALHDARAQGLHLIELQGVLNEKANPGSSAAALAPGGARA